MTHGEVEGPPPVPPRTVCERCSATMLPGMWHTDRRGARRNTFWTRCLCGQRYRWNATLPEVIVRLAPAER